MGFQYVVEGRQRARYERLTSIDEKVARPRRRWVAKMNGKLKGLRIPRSRKLNWRAFSLVLLPRRIVEIYAEVLGRMKMDDMYPTIVFSGQWGLPMLSYSSSRCRNAISVPRNLSCF
ncbi:hypothetical protein NMG60_11021036 [Bertholletia excelsa]